MSEKPTLIAYTAFRPDFILPVEVLSCLFRGLFLAKLVAAHRAGRLKFFGVHAHCCAALCFSPNGRVGSKAADH